MHREAAVRSDARFYENNGIISTIVDRDETLKAKSFSKALWCVHTSSARRVLCSNRNAMTQCVRYTFKRDAARTVKMSFAFVNITS